MGQVTSGVHSVLSSPAVYNATQTVFGAKRYRTAMASDYLRVEDGWCVLDIGCGTGEIVKHLPSDIRYYGFDLSAAYVERARQKHGRDGIRFEQSDVAEFLATGEVPLADLVMALNVLHHLDDGPAVDLVEVAASALKPGGRFVTLDPTYTPDQSSFSRWVTSKDRGKSVRRPHEYRELVQKTFSQVTVHVRYDITRIPSPANILECVK